MDPEYEAIVLFISTTKWSIKVISIDRRTPPNTIDNSLHYTIDSLPFTLGNWSLRKGSTKSRRTQKIFTATRRKIQARKIQLARIQLEKVKG